MLFTEIGHQFPIADNNGTKALWKNFLENENYIVFIASDTNNLPCGIITLNEGSSVYVGANSAQFENCMLLRKSDLPVLANHFFRVLLNLLEAKDGKALR